MDWIQEYNGVFTHGEISTSSNCNMIGCTRYNGCLVDYCICYRTFPCQAKAMPIK